MSNLSRADKFVIASKGVHDENELARLATECHLLIRHVGADNRLLIRANAGSEWLSPEDFIVNHKSQIEMRLDKAESLAVSMGILERTRSDMQQELNNLSEKVESDETIEVTSAVYQDQDSIRFRYRKDWGVDFTKLSSRERYIYAYGALTQLYNDAMGVETTGLKLATDKTIPPVEDIARRISDAPS